MESLGWNLQSATKPSIVSRCCPQRALPERLMGCLETFRMMHLLEPLHSGKRLPALQTCEFRICQGRAKVFRSSSIWTEHGQSLSLSLSPEQQCCKRVQILYTVHVIKVIERLKTYGISYVGLCNIIPSPSEKFTSPYFDICKGPKLNAKEGCTVAVISLSMQRKP